MATGVCLRGDAGGVKLSPVGAEVSVQVSSECQLFYNVHKAIKKRCDQYKGCGQNITCFVDINYI